MIKCINLIWLGRLSRHSSSHGSLRLNTGAVTSQRQLLWPTLTFWENQVWSCEFLLETTGMCYRMIKALFFTQNRYICSCPEVEGLSLFNYFYIYILEQSSWSHTFFKACPRSWYWGESWCTTVVGQRKGAYLPWLASTQVWMNVCFRSVIGSDFVTNRFT